MSVSLGSLKLYRKLSVPSALSIVRRFLAVLSRSYSTGKRLQEFPIHSAYYRVMFTHQPYLETTTHLHTHEPLGALGPRSREARLDLCAILHTLQAKWGMTSVTSHSWVSVSFL